MQLDYAIVWMLAQHSAFDGETLRQALLATFGRRQVTLPVEAPLALTSLFAGDRVKQRQWAAILRKSRPAAPPAGAGLRPARTAATGAGAAGGWAPVLAAASAWAA